MRRDAVLLILLASCDRPPAPSPGSVTPSPTPPAAIAPVVLDGPTLDRFLRSMTPPAAPVAFLFRDPGSNPRLTDVEAADSFVQAFGFRDFSEYVMVWGRVSRARIAVLAEEFDRKAMELLESHIRSSEKELQRPDLPEDLREEHRQLVIETRKAIAELKAKTLPAHVPPEDFRLIRENRERVDAAWEELKK